MANIQQAAKWMQEGREVERASSNGAFWCVAWEPMRIGFDISCADGGRHELDLFDLLADDWEIAQKAGSK